MLSRKNYIGISKVIHEVSKTRKFVVVPKNESVNGIRSRTYIDIDHLIDGLVDYFGDDNPNFDEQKFRAVSRSTALIPQPVYIQREE